MGAGLLHSERTPVSFLSAKNITALTGERALRASVSCHTGWHALRRAGRGIFLQTARAL